MCARWRVCSSMFSRSMDCIALFPYARNAHAYNTRYDLFRKSMVARCGAQLRYLMVTVLGDTSGVLGRVSVR